jgi:hypothetical protein
MSRFWSGVCEASRIDLRSTGTESHSSLNVGETLHAPLRRIFRKVIEDNPDYNSDYALSISVKALKDTTKMMDFARSYLFLGLFHRFLTHTQYTLANAIV